MRVKKLFSWLLVAVMCVQMLSVTSFALKNASQKSISGAGVEVTYNDGTITLHLADGDTVKQMSKPSTMGYPIINGVAVQDFTSLSCDIERNIVGLMGVGERMTIVSQSESTGLLRTYTLETSASVQGAIYTTTSYTAGSEAIAVEWFVDNEFELFDVGDTIWSYNGGGEGPSHSGDTILKIDLTDQQLFSRENRQDYTAASIPVSDIYTSNGGITVGDASATRREVRTPIYETTSAAKVLIKWPGVAVEPLETVSSGESIVVIHTGDYFCGLRGYSNAMEHVGIVMPTDLPDSSYDLRWESWGWEFNWTVDLIIGKLDELEAAGVKQITLDDGWYDSAGDWGLSPSKFPNGVADMTRLTDAIHSHGMTAVLWWRPCDGGQNSKLYQEHPEYFVKNEDGTTGKLDGAGRFGNFFHGTGYALCPASVGAIASQVDFVNRAMNDWGFDGFKGDFVWGMPKCYDTTHGHPYPEDSTEKQAEFYRTTHEAMIANDPNVFNLLCNCGTPQDYYSLQYMTQIATADPTSLDQTRRRVKAYKALMGDYFPVTTDHNDIWYATTVGTGAVLIEKRAFTGAAQAEYERWLDIANRLELHKGRFVGDLYCYGFDPYETYVVEKDDTLYYAFYRDGAKYRPSGNPPVELKGLDANKMYRVVDYLTGEVVATNLMGDNAVFNYPFSSYLLVKAVEIDTPDPDPIDPDAEFTFIEEDDPALVYTGIWNDDPNSAFHGGSAKYTSIGGSSVEFTFTGTGIRWYGQKDTNFGVAKVYLDDELVDTVDCSGSMAVKQKLYESPELPYGMHTIAVVCDEPVIDIDYFAVTTVIPDSQYITIEEDSEQLYYVGNWYGDRNSEFSGGGAKYTNSTDSYVEFHFTGTAIRWYGQKDTNFGTAHVYLDGELVSSINVNGEMATGVVLFEATGLPATAHTIRIVCADPTIDIDRLSYVP